MQISPWEMVRVYVYLLFQFRTDASDSNGQRRFSYSWADKKGMLEVHQFRPVCEQNFELPAPPQIPITLA